MTERAMLTIIAVVLTLLIVGFVASELRDSLAELVTRLR